MRSRSKNLPLKNEWGGEKETPTLVEDVRSNSCLEFPIGIYSYYLQNIHSYAI